MQKSLRTLLFIVAVYAQAEQKFNFTLPKFPVIHTRALDLSDVALRMSNLFFVIKRSTCLSKHINDFLTTVCLYKNGECFATLIKNPLEKRVAFQRASACIDAITY